MRRSSNQDCFAIALAEDRDQWEHAGHLFIVADGMGAHAAGELASRMSVDLIPHHYAKLNRGDAPAALMRAMEEANQEIYRRGQANPEFRSMGTTACALALLPMGAVVSHVGDSRVYRLRGTTLEQLTFDHSLVWEMRASGDLSEEALRSNAIPKNVITRSLGPSPTVQVDLEGPFPLQRGDRFLLCSDGLSGQLTDEEIGMLLGTLDIDKAVRGMVDLSNLRGGPDNITVVIAEVTDDTLTKAVGTSTTPRRPKVSYPIAFAIVAAICGLACLVLLLVRQFPLALISFAAAAVAAVTGWVKWQIASGTGERAEYLGKGPYRKYQCKPTAAFCQQLVEVIGQLQDWVKGNGTPIDLNAFDAKLAAGQEAIAAKNYKLAIVSLIDALIIIMREIKQIPDGNDDEAIEY